VRVCTPNGPSGAALVAYIHNNPVRAGVVSDPANSAWTSHRAYLGLATPPTWLDVEQGLRLCGFAATSSGRRAFHSFVLSRVGQPRSVELSGGDLRLRRKDARAHTSSPVEIAAPSVLQRHESFEVDTPIVAPEGCVIRQHWSGPPDAILSAAARAAGTTLSQLCARGRTREVVAARRLALLTWSRYLSRPVVHMARALGIAESSAAELIATAPRSLHEQAAALARAMCAT
jgi:hypothetical protein